MGRTRKTETRTEALDRIVAREYGKGTTLAETRKILAKELGGAPSLYLGTADPRYYRLVGLDSPLPAPSKTRPYVAKDGKTSKTLAVAVRRRRDEDGVRWNVLAASVEATIGRPVSESEARALYAAGGGDEATSYVGRGTRAGAPSTRLAPETAVRGKA